MKTLKLLMCSFCLLSFSLFAAEGEKNKENTSAATSNKKDISLFLTKSIEYPIFMLNSMGSRTVTVEFMIQEDSTVAIQGIQSKNELLAAYVKEQLTTQKFFSENLEIKNTYAVKITFK